MANDEPVFGSLAPLSQRLLNEVLLPGQPGNEFGLRSRLATTPESGAALMGEMLVPDRSIPWKDRLAWGATPEGGLELAANIIGGPALGRVAGGVAKGVRPASGSFGSMAPAAPEIVTPQPGIRAYHGSPHQFDRFDINRIGAGEGAQVYGHGLYFAENEAVARSYRDMNPSASVPPRRVLLGQELEPGSPEYHAGTLLSTMGRSLPQVRKEVAGWIANAKPGENVDHYRAVFDTLNRVSGKRDFSVLKPQGHMYEVNIRAQPEQFLDWDRPLSEQSPSVRQFFEGRKSDAPVYPDTPGQHLPAFINPDRRVAAAAMREAGIPGLRYFDQGSRGAGDGTRNLVLFDDSIIDILKRYGIAGAAAAPAAAASFGSLGPQEY